MIYAKITMQAFDGGARLTDPSVDNMLKHVFRNIDTSQWRSTDPDDPTITIIAIQDDKFEESVNVIKITNQTALAMKADFIARKPVGISYEV